MATGEKWLADLLRAGLETRLISESDILAHATPAVLMSALPRALMVRVLDGALTSGVMSPKAVLETATPDILAAHVPAPVVWACIAAAAERAGFAAANGAGDKAAGDKRDFLRRALAASLGQMVTPKDLVEHVNAQVIGTAFPDAMTTKLIEVSLASGKMTPELIVQTIGVDAIAEHVPAPIVWTVIAGAAKKLSAEPPLREGVPLPLSTRLPLDALDDDMDLIVELDTPAQAGAGGPPPKPQPGVVEVAADKPSKLGPFAPPPGPVKRP